MTEPRVVATIHAEDLPTYRAGLDSLGSDSLKAMLQAVAGEHSFESAGVDDTPMARALFAEMQAQYRALPPGAILDVPFFD